MSSMRAISCISCFIALLIALGDCLPSAAAETAFDAAQRSLAIVRTKRSAGSGFLVELSGTKYLITSEHVLRGGQPVSAQLLNGERLGLIALEVCPLRDMVRIKLEDQRRPALRLGERSCTIGDAVTVLGNSDGSGVVTPLKGAVLGIGPDRLEVDAMFVQGNSGSPIIADDFSVLAVATYVTRARDPHDWVKANTRFSEVRRFGMRLEGAKWERIDVSDYFLRVDALADIETFCSDAHDLLRTDKYRTDRKFHPLFYDAKENRKRYRKYYSLCDMLSATAEELSSYTLSLDAQERDRWLAKEGFRNYQEAERDRFMSKARVKRAQLDARTAVVELYKTPASFIRQNDWQLSSFRSEAEFWRDVLAVLTNVDVE